MKQPHAEGADSFHTAFSATFTACLGEQELPLLFSVFIFFNRSRGLAATKGNMLLRGEGLGGVLKAHRSTMLAPTEALLSVGVPSC